MRKEEEGEETGHLRGEDVATGVKAVNPLFPGRREGLCFFLFLFHSLLPSHTHINTDSNINAETHSNSLSAALSIRSSHLYGTA